MYFVCFFILVRNVIFLLFFAVASPTQGAVGAQRCIARRDREMAFVCALARVSPRIARRQGAGGGWVPQPGSLHGCRGGRTRYCSSAGMVSLKPRAGKMMWKTDPPCLTFSA